VDEPQKQSRQLKRQYEETTRESQERIAAQEQQLKKESEAGQDPPRKALAESDLRQIMPRIPREKFEIYLALLNWVMEDSEINTPLRAAAFLAQIAHESGELRRMEEITGPTEAQRRYEPPGDQAARLGNTQPGDGERFKGRGAIQITGRANYQRYGDLLGVDLVNNPDLAATPQIGFQVAAAYWTANGLNELADAGDFTTITQRINGGLNGLEDRLKYYDIAKNVLGGGD
jgi:predicted chitinase